MADGNRIGQGQTGSRGQSSRPDLVDDQDVAEPMDQAIADPAEAVSGGLEHWYCHECSTELDSLTSDSLCPQCFGSFVEMIDQQDDPRFFDAEEGVIAFDGSDHSDSGGGDRHDLAETMEGRVGRQIGLFFEQLMQREMQPSTTDPVPNTQSYNATPDEGTDEADGTTLAGADAERSQRQAPFFRVENMNLGPNSQGVRIIGSRLDGRATPSAAPTPPSNTQERAQPEPSPPVVNLSTFLQQAFGDNYNNLGHGEQRTGTEGGTRARPESMNSLAAVMQTIAQAFGMTGNPGDYLSQQGLDDFITNLMEQQDSHASAGASKETLDSLPRHKLSSDEAVTNSYTECAICKDDFVAGSDILVLPCKHSFDESCIIQWLEKSATCPVCRFILNAPASQQPAGANVPPDHDRTSSATVTEIPPTEELD